MSRAIAKMLEKYYRDELKSCVNRIEKFNKNPDTSKLKDSEFSVYNRVFNTINAEMDSLSEFTESKLNNDEICIGIAVELLIKKYDSIDDEQLSDIVGSRLPRYAFVRTMLKESKQVGDNLCKTIREHGVEYVLKSINLNKKECKKQD